MGPIGSYDNIGVLFNINVVMKCTVDVIMHGSVSTIIIGGSLAQLIHH